MAPPSSGNKRIDKLMVGAADAVPIEEMDKDVAAVRIIQDLVNGTIKFKTVNGRPRPEAALEPTFFVPGYGVYSPQLLKRLRAFRVAAKLQKPTDKVVVDARTLQLLVAASATTPLATVGYMTLYLNLPYSIWVRFVALVAMKETTAGRFEECNLGGNDKAGLSFGIIQWAQSQGRLDDIVQAFKDTDKGLFASIFGKDADKMLAVISSRKGSYGVKNGKSEYTRPEWVTRLEQAGRDPVFQRSQVSLAVNTFKEDVRKIREVDSFKVFKSERAIAFMNDFVNQHGGFAGSYNRVIVEGLSEKEALERMRDESLRRLRYTFTHYSFKPTDMLAVVTLATRLSKAEDALAQRLGKQLTKPHKALLEKFVKANNQARKPLAKSVREAVAAELNEWIDVKKKDANKNTIPLYDATAFKDVRLSPETDAVLKQNPKEGDMELKRLNRLLLQDGFPEVLSLDFNNPLFGAVSNRLGMDRSILGEVYWVDRLKSAPEPVSAFIRGRLSTSTRRMLDEYQFPAQPKAQLIRALVEALNKLVEGPALFDPELFKDVKLLPETEFLLKQNPTGDGLRSLNHMLLADAYPSQLARINENNQVWGVAKRRDEYRFDTTLADTDFAEA